MRFFLFSLVFILFVVGCSTKPEKVLPSKDGKWAVKGTEESTISGSPTVYSAIDATIFFAKGGTGTVTEDGVKSSITWNIDASDNITITSGNGGGITYKITEQKRNSEKWSYENLNFVQPGEPMQKINLTLTRIK